MYHALLSQIALLFVLKQPKALEKEEQGGGNSLYEALIMLLTLHH